MVVWAQIIAVLDLNVTKKDTSGLLHWRNWSRGEIKERTVEKYIESYVFNSETAGHWRQAEGNCGK